ncbi:hypothetical protein [Granulicella sp. S156]|uniref:hypothetical protein n=1 Tax=Granulicella sp. S156 TaxID=1747224 RepID=UPI00131DFE5A|nr:hypothetical protein [Granulicella sp. S156]
MANEINTKTTLWQRAIRELKAFVLLTAYFYVTFGSVIFMKAAILHTHGIHYVAWGSAIVKAVLIAKFMLVGRALKIGEGYKGQPLIWPTLHKAFGFLLLLVIMTAIEEAVVGLFHHRSISAMVGELIGPRLGESVAEIVFLLLVLIPFVAFSVLADALGEVRLQKMFFTEPMPLEQNSRSENTTGV